MPPELGPRLLARPLVEFLRAHPELELECEVRLATLAATEDFDVAIGLSRGPWSDTSVVSQRLASLESVVVASPELVRQSGRIRSVRDLRRVPCISTASALAGAPWQFYVDGGRTRSAPIRAHYRVDSAEMALTAACAGLGFALLPLVSCAPSLREKSLVRVTLDRMPAPLDVFAALPSRDFVPLRVRRLLEHLRASLSKLR